MESEGPAKKTTKACYVCERCGYQANSKSRLTAHLNRKRPCVSKSPPPSEPLSSPQVPPTTNDHEASTSASTSSSNPRNVVKSVTVSPDNSENDKVSNNITTTIVNDNQNDIVTDINMVSEMDDDFQFHIKVTCKTTLTKNGKFVASKEFTEFKNGCVIPTMPPFFVKKDADIETHMQLVTKYIVTFIATTQYTVLMHFIERVCDYAILMLEIESPELYRESQMTSVKPEHIVLSDNYIWGEYHKCFKWIHKHRDDLDENLIRIFERYIHFEKTINETCEQSKLEGCSEPEE